MISPSEHRTRHEMLHAYLDELVADYIQYGSGSIFHSIKDFTIWSHKQTLLVQSWQHEIMPPPKPYIETQSEDLQKDLPASGSISNLGKDFLD